jgi:hypothetical protein
MVQESVASTQLPTWRCQPGAGNRVVATAMLSAIRCGICRVGSPGPRSTAKSMHRWTATFLLLAMLFPAFGPLALAQAAQPEAMHCIRRPARFVQPAMHCHHAMAESAAQEVSEKSLRSLDGCCQNHDCCRCLRTSEWVCPASNLLVNVSLLIESAPAARFVVQISPASTGQNSTRAPPRS